MISHRTIGKKTPSLPMNQSYKTMNRYFLLLISLVLFSCSKNGDSTLTKNQAFSAECLKSAEPMNFDQTCYFDSTYHCDLIEYPDEIPISDENREWLKAFCLNDFDRIFFHDEDGNETYLEIAEKRFMTMRQNIGIDTCAGERLSVYCVKTEFANVEIRVPIASMTINLGIRNNFNVQDNGKIISSVVVEAYTLDASIQPVRYISHLNVIPEFDNSLLQEFSPEMDILDKTFEEVYTSNNTNLFVSPNPDALKIFYNKEFGIVSFIDNNGTQWVLND